MDKITYCGLALICLVLVAATPADFVKGRVLRVTDLNSLEVKFEGGVHTVRLLGIAVMPPWHPVRGRDPYAESGAAFARDELSGQDAYLEFSETQHHPGGLVWAYVWTERPERIDKDSVRALMFNAQLILRGYAIEASNIPDDTYAEYFAEFQREARLSNRGLWQLQ